MKHAKKVLKIATNFGLVNVELFYVGEINWDAPMIRLNNQIREWATKFASGILDSTKRQKFSVVMADGTSATRSITASMVKDMGNLRLNINLTKPFGKSHLASHIHAQLKATTKNMATEKEIADISSQLNELNTKVLALQAKRTELENNRKVVANEHDVLAHFGKLMELAFAERYKFSGVVDDRFCKVLHFMENGKTKELPVSVYMVNEQVTNEHNVASASSHIVPMPIIHVLNKQKIMVPVSDLTPIEIMGLLI